MERDTVGKISSELLMKESETKDPVELEREMQQDYIKNLCECIELHSKTFPGDFFIIVITKNEKLMPNVFRNYFSARLTCPTPDYDQTVYHYRRKEECVEYVWTVPSRDACFHLREHAAEVHPSEHGLLNFVLQFADGTLYNKMKQLNGEKEDSLELEKPSSIIV